MNPALRRGLWFAAFLLVLGALMVPRLVPNNEAEETAPAKEAEETKPIAVETLLLEPQRLVERLETTGTVRANEQVEVVSEIAGKVVEIRFEEGSRVESGEVLVKIDDAELLAQRLQIVHQLDLAQRREERQRELLDDGVISEQDYDFALSQKNVLEAELSRVEVRLEKTQIRAPFSGVVGLRSVSLGAYLTPQTRIASLQDVDPVKVDFSVPEKYAGLLRPGSEVVFRVSGSEEPHVGKIYAVEPMVDPETRSLTLRAKSPNPGGLLLPGAFADVEVTVRDVENALAVPNLAVIPELGGKKVFVAEGGKAVERHVTTGIRSAEQVEVTSGLEPGERVIVSAIQQLRPGIDIVDAGMAEETAP